MTRILLPILASMTLFAVTACSSAQSDWDSQLMPRSEGNPDPNVIAVDAMNVRKPMPLGSKNASTDFFFKKCEQNGSGSFYSKTSYDCGEIK
jgi:hypothetical protein